MSDAPEPQPEIKSTRLMFDAEFVKRSEEFCNQAITAIPELHGIAIVPLWNSHHDELPPGLLSLRFKEPPYTASLLLLLRKLALFNVDVHKDLVGQLQMLDQYAAHLAEQVKKNIEELEQPRPVDPANEQKS
jgi:hypothetical protein